MGVSGLAARAHGAKLDGVNERTRPARRFVPEASRIRHLPVALTNTKGPLSCDAIASTAAPRPVELDLLRLVVMGAVYDGQLAHVRKASMGTDIGAPEFVTIDTIIRISQTITAGCTSTGVHSDWGRFVTQTPPVRMNAR